MKIRGEITNKKWEEDRARAREMLTYASVSGE